MKKFWVILIIIIIAILLFYFLATLILNQKINQTLISLRNSGFATTIAEIKPKSSAEAKRTAELLTDAYEAMKIEDKTERNIAAQESDIADSIDYEENPALFNKIVTDNTKVINLLLEASKYPYADFGLNYQDGLAAKISQPAIHLNNYCCLLRIYAKNLYGAGKTEEALNVLRKTVNLSFSLIDIMFLFHLVKALALTKTLDLIQTISPKGSVTALESLAAEIAKIDVRSSFTKVNEAEMVMWQYIFSSGKKLQDNVFGSGMLLTPRQRFLLFLANLAPVRKYTQLRLLNLMEKEILLTKLPYYQTEKDWNAMEESIRKSGTFSDLEKIFIPNLKIFVVRTENLEAKRNITLLGLKTIIQKKKTGKLPKTLNEIIGNFPTDPFNGKEYVYQTLPDGYLIYSVGKDGKDDMGDPKNDIVWKIKI